MIAQLKALFTPPVFPEDEEKTRIAKLLNIILLAVMGLVMAFSVPAFVMTPKIGRFVIEFILAGWSLIILVILRRGRVYGASFLFTLTLWVVVTYGTYEAGGFRGSTMSAYFGILLIAELLLGVKISIVFGVLSVLATGWMVLADSAGLMPPAPEYATLGTFWAEFSAVVIGVVVLTSLVMSNLQQALRRARNNEKELAVKVEEVQILAQRATEANEFKSKLIARISHELRTPLGALIGMSELLQQEIYGPLSPQQLDIINRIIYNSHALERVFSELLDQSQIESGQLRLRLERFSPKDLAESVYLNLMPQTKKKGLDLVLDVKGNAPDFVVGDYKRVEQVLSNLVVNAIKFTENGRITITIYQADDSHWALQVSDTGIGISKEDQAFIFEPFRQADESMARKFGGVGLGLAIVQQLTSAMGGAIELQSEVGKGSRFTITLPLQAAKEHANGNQTIGFNH
jgi:signal transduction histidine kinase